MTMMLMATMIGACDNDERLGEAEVHSLQVYATHRIVAGDVPQSLQGRRVIALEMGSLVAGVAI